MSIVSRLFDIARAQVGNRLSQGARVVRDHSPGRSEPQASSEQKAGPRSQTDSAARDPQLARYYANLELPYGAGLEEVKEAWKRLMRQYHPDLHSNDAEKQKIATEIVQGLNLAYEQLKKRLER